MSEWKNTEFGDIPAEWKIQTLDSVCKKITDGSHFSPKEDPGGQYRIGTVKDMVENDFDLKNCKKISKKDFNLLVKNGCKVEKGDVLFSKDGSIGNVIYFDKDYDLVLLSSIAILKSNTYQLSGKFLYYYLKSNFSQYQVRRNFVSGSALPRVVLKDIKKIKILLPSLSEQNRISDCLSKIDDKIDLLRHQNETLEQIAQTLFKRWFVEFEFPDENGQPYKSSGGKMVPSELGEIPEGWKASKIKDYGSIVCGKTPSKKRKDYFNGEIPFIKIPDMHGKVFIIKTEDTLSKKGSNTQKTKVLPKYSINVSCIATVGLVTINSRSSHTNQQINSIIPN